MVYRGGSTFKNTAAFADDPRLVHSIHKADDTR